MSSNDFAISATSFVPSNHGILKKPCYLIILHKKEGKVETTEHFISLDKPELLNGFIQAKGVYCGKSKEEIVKQFNEILSNTPKELIEELMIPNHKVELIKSLVFSAVKNNTNQTGK